MKLKIKSFFYVRFSPSFDLLIACLTEVLVIGAYYAVNHLQDPFLNRILSKIVLSLILTVLFPVMYITLYKKQPLASLGIKRHLSGVAIVVSIIFSLACFYFLKGHGPELSYFFWSKLFLHGLTLWEPLFVYGWLQLRFENAFGAIPAMILSGICFGLYHVGSLPIGTVLSLVGIGILYGVLFRLVGNNLFVLFPITWAVGNDLEMTTNQFSMVMYGDVRAILLVILLIAWIFFMDEIRKKAI